MDAVLMEDSHKNTQFRTKVKPALRSKLEEFYLLGYKAVSEDELWDYLIKKKWKKVTEEMMIHEIIQDILSIKVSDYMNFATIEAYKTTEFSFEDENELNELLK